MPELGAPWALAGLFLVPLIRWLHRFAGRQRPYRVSALFLWRDAVHGAGAGRRRPRPDPAWRRRALVAALLVLALAGPRRPGVRVAPLPVLFDDAPSMQTREAGVERRHALVKRLLSAVDAAGIDALELRPLRGGGPALRLEAATRSEWPERIRAWLPEAAQGPPHPPPAGAYWLASDGADPRVAQRLAVHPPRRILRIGSATENLALTRLAVRPAPAEPGRLAVTVEAYNAGLAAARGRLDISAGSALVRRQRLELPAGERALVTFDVPADTPGLEAHLQRPGEALTLDDRLALDPSGLIRPLGLYLAGTCGTRVRAALTAHPRLEPTGSGTAEIAVSCGEGEPDARLPLLRLADPSDMRPLRHPPHWTQEAGPLARLRPAGADLQAVPLPARPGDVPLLSSGTAPLVLLREGPPPVVRVGLDLETAADPRDRLVPTLLAGLLDRLLGRELLEDYLGVGRDPGSARIAPGDLPAPAAPSAPRNAREAADDLSPYLLWAALLVLLADTLLPLRREAGA